MSNTTSAIFPHIVTFTPTLAAEYLAKNTHNRKTRDRTVLRYANDMASDLWTFAADPIRRTSDGTVLDGQHRLKAITHQDDDFTIDMLVVDGLPPESQRVMDQGSKRTAGDQLALAGVRNSINVASAVRWVLLIDSGLLFRDANVQKAMTSSPRIEEWCRQHEDAANDMSDMAPTARKTEASPAIALAVGHFIAQEWGADVAMGFLRPLANGGAAENSPINVADQTLRSANRRHVRVPRRDQLALLIRAFNSHMKGETRTRFNQPTGGKWTSENFPTIVTRAEVSPR